MTYMLNAEVPPLHGMLMGRRRRKLEEQFSPGQSGVLESQ
jgi:hypothetical protein